MKRENYLVIRQTRDGDVYGKPKYVSAETITGALEKAFGPTPPSDYRLDRVLVFDLDSGAVTAVPVKVPRPSWSKSVEWVAVG